MEKLRFLHMPKTAGSTFSKILKNQYGGGAHFTLGRGNDEDIRRYHELPDNIKNSIVLFTGHAPILTGIPEADGATIITILRDPVSRVVSFCQHVSEGKSPHLLNKYPPETFNLDEFLSSDNNEISNLQSRMLIDFEKYRKVPLLKSSTAAEMKECALENLFEKVSWYGIQEYFDESLILFTSKLGWRTPYYEYQNKKNVKRLLTFEDRHIDRIKEMNMVDIDVYKEAKRVFLNVIDSDEYDSERFFRFQRMQKLISPMLHMYGVVGRKTAHLLS